MKRLLVAAALSVLLATSVYLPVCDLVFRCGCTWFFLGGSAGCNMHHPLPPHCPVCVGDPINALAFGALMVTVSFAAFWLALSRRRSPP